MNVDVSLFLLQLILPSLAAVLQVGMPKGCQPAAHPPNCRVIVTMEPMDDVTDDRINVTLKASALGRNPQYTHQWLAVGFSDTGGMINSSIAECLVALGDDSAANGEAATFISSFGTTNSKDPSINYARCQDMELIRSVISEPISVRKEGKFYVCQFTYAVSGQNISGHANDSKGCIVRHLDEDLHILLAYGYAINAQRETPTEETTETTETTTPIQAASEVHIHLLLLVSLAVVVLL